MSDLDGAGEVVSGIIVMRQGENALDVIERVKARLEEIKPGLPPGVEIVTTYDRSDLILRSIDNLKNTLTDGLTGFCQRQPGLRVAFERPRPDTFDRTGAACASPKRLRQSAGDPTRSSATARTQAAAGGQEKPALRRQAQ